MYSQLKDTIAARATPPGRGGVGIVRLSGSLVTSIASAMIGFLPTPRYATFANFKDSKGLIIDQGIALYFKSPHSFTGEDILELQGHGGPIVIDQLLKRVVQLGARVALPGEFSLRAFLNNKIDLTQAEAIADLIEAASAEAANSAIQSLQGKFSQEINKVVDQIITLRMYVEAAIDFPEEEVDFLTDGKIQQTLETILLTLGDILGRATQGSVLSEGMKIVIVGRPNAGKSSLLNALCGEEAAIVSEMPGTTRDVVKETLLIDGMPLFVLDTAGLREAADEIEAEGIKRAWREIPRADQILLVVDASEHPSNELDQHPLYSQLKEYKEKLTIIRNKIDLTGEALEIDTCKRSGVIIINMSLKESLGIKLLRQHLKKCIGYQGNENVFIARRRHLEALRLAKDFAENALRQLVIYKAGELVAQDLWQAQYALQEITGQFRSDDLLGKIFSSFCIGK